MNKKLVIAALSIVGGLMGAYVAGVKSLKKYNRKVFREHLELPSVALEFEDKFKDQLSEEDAKVLKSIYDGIESLEGVEENPKTEDVEKLAHLYTLMGDLIDKYTEHDDVEEDDE